MHSQPKILICYNLSIKYFLTVIIAVILVLSTTIVVVAARRPSSSKQTFSRYKFYSTPTITPIPSPTLTPTPTLPPKHTLWGAYAGGELADIINFQTRINQPMNYLATFVHWGNENEFPTEIASHAAKNKSTLVIFWEAMDYNQSAPADPRFSYDRILAGDWNTYIDSFAQSVKAYGQTVILVPFEEMNSDWYPWSGNINGNTPAKHIAAYRYLRSRFTGITNVRFGWTVNNDSVPDTSQNTIANYYPGNDYVDYIGVDGFNFDDPWQTYHQIFDTALNQLSAYHKPLIIFSMASAQGSQKAAWIKDALTEIDRNRNITGWIWFNENKEKDWTVWSDPQSLSTFINNLPR